MKDAAADDHWRRVRDTNRPRPLKLSDLQYAAITSLGNGTLPLHPSLTVICGANGVGKSSLLALCRLTLGFDVANARLKTRHESAEVSIRILGSGHATPQEISLKQNVCANPSNIKFKLYQLDPGVEYINLRQLIEIETNWDELLNQYGAKQLDPEQLDELAYLTGKSYSEGRVFEIEDFGNLPVFPYFIVKSGGMEYRFEEMGAGEGALFLAWWKIQQIREPGILLLEEPETHITPHSQRALMNYIALLSSKQICCVVTTHSVNVISYVPQECLRLVVRNQGAVQIIVTPDEGQLYSALGIDVPKKLTILVEDKCACVITKEILRIFRPAIAANVHVADAGNDSRLIAVLKNFPTSLPGPRLLGMLDGDKKADYDLTGRGNEFIPDGANHPLEFLPGTVLPEEFLKSACIPAPDELAKRLGIELSRVTAAFASVDGLDPHDWLEQLSQRLNISFERMTQTILHIAIMNEEVNSECNEIANRVASMISE